MPAVRPGAKGGVISGWGTAVPPKVITNDDLAASMDTSDEWIRTRTGIGQRYVGGSTVELGVEAGRLALGMAGLTPERIDALILATSTPESQWGTATAIQHELGLSCGAFEINAACSGFVYAFVQAHGLLAVGADRILLIGSDTVSRITDPNDRATAPLFGDGAGAVVIESVDGPGQLVSWDLDADGSALSILTAEVGGYIKMEGKEVFRRAVRLMVESAQNAMEHAGVTADDIAMVVPHQANTRIIDAACERLGIPRDRAAVVLERFGNTSAASVPLALTDALETGRITYDDLVLLVGFGGGMTAASAIINWGGGVG